jgi:hypothetical protein
VLVAAACFLGASAANVLVLTKANKLMPTKPSNIFLVDFIANLLISLNVDYQRRIWR